MTLKSCRCVFMCVYVCSLVLKVLPSLQSVSVVWQVVSGLLSPPPFHPFSSHTPQFLHLPLPSQSLLAALVSSLSLWGFSLSLVSSVPLITVEDEWTLKPNTSCVCEREGGTQLLPRTVDRADLLIFPCLQWHYCDWLPGAVEEDGGRGGVRVMHDLTKTEMDKIFFPSSFHKHSLLFTRLSTKLVTWYFAVIRRNVSFGLMLRLEPFRSPKRIKTFHSETFQNKRMKGLKEKNVHLTWLFVWR